MKRAYAAAVMVASGLLAPAAMPAAQAQTTPNDTAQDNQKDSGSTAHRVPPFDPGYWTPERMRDAKPAPMPSFPKGQDPVKNDDSVTHTVAPDEQDPNYWTPERMRNAQPVENGVTYNYKILKDFFKTIRG